MKTRGTASEFKGRENGNDVSIYGLSNELQRTDKALGTGCSRTSRYWQDLAGNRLVQLDTVTGGTYDGPQSILSYTAKGQLFFAMSPTAQVGTYDHNWHWYDAAGRRMLTTRTTSSTWVPSSIPATAPRTHYVYDGHDIALSIVRSGGSWWVKARYLTGGVDDVVAGRFRTEAGVTRTLALVNDRQGTTLAAMRPDGTQEDNATYFTRDPYGGLIGASGTGSPFNTETGFTGASTPNQTGGFVYLRNRWYDPQTGRFLTQDPIGLAGGVNLYSYAGSNPVNFSDPFGLDCPARLSAAQFFLCHTMRAGWEGLGALVGFGIGGGTGLVETVASGGTLAPLAVVQTAAATAAGAAIGTRIGDWVTDQLFSDESGGAGGGSAPRYKVPRDNQSAQEAAKDIPSWAQGQRPFVGESGKTFARRLLNDRYGAGNYKVRGDTEFSKLKKYADRHFIDPE